MADPALTAYDQWLARREERIRMCAAGGEDRLSALPDDVLRLILCRLDTRSALATASLSKHWARLPRDLPMLDFRVGDILPERYRRYLRRRFDAVGSGQRDALVRKLDVLIARYERQSMRSLARAVRSFVDEDASDDGHGEATRSTQSMSLEMFPTHNSAPFNRLIAKAVGDWGVQDLEVVVLNPTPSYDVVYSFPHHCFDDSKLPGVLKTLKLSNCMPLAASNGDSTLGAPQAFHSLTVLVLQGMPKLCLLYQRVIQACPMLEVLHIKSCLFRGRISIDAPDSCIKELVIDACTFKFITLHVLPRLERLAYRGAPVEFIFGSLPRLTRLNLSFYDDPNARADPRFFGPLNEYSHLKFSSHFPDLESLVVRFTGPDIWVVPDLRPPLGNLRRLLVMDMPRSWDISWTCRLLEAAPLLEIVHVHVADHDMKGATFGPAIPEPPSGFKHHVLREVVIAGFRAVEAHIHFVRFLRTACKALMNVVLLKHGHVGDKGLWDWEMVASREEYSWSDEERGVLLRNIEGGDAASSTVRIVLG